MVDLTAGIRQQQMRVRVATGRTRRLAQTSLFLMVLTNCVSSCHGATGSGANTNVEDGLYLSSRDDSAGNGDIGAANTPDNSPLLGGGFINYQGAAVTSAHSTDGTDALAWGHNVNRGQVGSLTEGLSCASCHDPHGSPNYRIINEVVNGMVVFVAQVDETAKDYDTEQWGAGTSSLCAACHGAYHRTLAGQGSIEDGGSYTHRVNMSYNFGGNVNPETVGLVGLPFRWQRQTR